MKKIYNKIKGKFAEIYNDFIVDYKKLKSFFEKDFSFKNSFIYFKDLINENIFFEFLFNLLMLGVAYLIVTNIKIIINNFNMFCHVLFFTVTFGLVVSLIHSRYVRKKKDTKKKPKEDPKNNDK